MNVRTWVAASVLLLAGSSLGAAFAQEPLEKAGTEPSTQAAPQPPAGMGNEPLGTAGTEPSMQAAPQAAPSHADEPLEKMGAGNDANAPDANHRQAATDAPATVVITELTAVKDRKKLVNPWGLPAERVAEMDVFDAAGKKIGQVDAVLEDKKGEVKGIAIGYGGFLGFGERGAIVTLDRTRLKDGAIVTELTEDQLSRQPEWPQKKK
jgi:sporulation protein YlmC with PRC-barrel domain